MSRRKKRKSPLEEAWINNSNVKISKGFRDTVLNQHKNLNQAFRQMRCEHYDSYLCGFCDGSEERQATCWYVRADGPDRPGQIEKKTALDTQIGGDHYKHFAIQPIEFTTKNNLGFIPGCVIKRICRYNRPGGKGLEDLQKIKHEIDCLIDMEFGGEKKNVCSLIEKVAEKYHTHPDPIARLYGAVHDVDAEMMGRLKQIREGANG